MLYAGLVDLVKNIVARNNLLGGVHESEGGTRITLKYEGQIIGKFDLNPQNHEETLLISTPEPPMRSATTPTAVMNADCLQAVIDQLSELGISCVRKPGIKVRSIEETKTASDAENNDT